MSDSNNDILSLEKKTADEYYHFKYNESNQNPEPRQNKINTYDDLNLAEWLKEVDGYKKINSLSIPGTHDSGARFNGILYKCQNLTIQEQLLNGVRYLDIRCRHINNCFMVHHTKKFQYLGFGGGVRDVCIDFLKKHSSEFIYMQLKEEYKSEKSSNTFIETLQRYITGYEYYFFLDEISPTLDQVRGKIVILRRFPSTVSPLGNELDFCGEIFTSHTTIIARIQDAFQVKTLLNRYQKWEKFLNLLREAVDNTDQDTLFINFGSGAAAFCCPYSTASYILPRLGNYLKNINQNKFVGVILLDYITDYYDDLIYYLVKRNI